MLNFVSQYAGNVHSQNGEDLLVQEILRRLGIATGVCCEVGGNDGHWLSNTRHLLENGWSGLFIEGSYSLYLESRQNWKDNPKVRHQCCYVDTHNINAFVKENCDLLSLDTDGSDFDLWAAIKAQPKIVIIEIDSSIPPGILQREDGFLGTYSNVVALGIMKGYFLVAHTGNLIFLLNDYRDLFPEIEGDPLLDSDLYFNRAWIKAAA